MASELEGTVTVWHGEQGWGVIEAPQTPGGCWAHFAGLAGEPAWEPKAGEPVRFTPEAADQDGFHWRATYVRPAGTARPLSGDELSQAPSTAYRSSVTLIFDDPRAT